MERATVPPAQQDQRVGMVQQAQLDTPARQVQRGQLALRVPLVQPGRQGALARAVLEAVRVRKVYRARTVLRVRPALLERLVELK